MILKVIWPLLPLKSQVSEWTKLWTVTDDWNSEQCCSLWAVGFVFFSPQHLEFIIFNIKHSGMLPIYLIPCCTIINELTDKYPWRNQRVLIYWYIFAALGDKHLHFDSFLFHLSVATWSNTLRIPICMYFMNFCTCAIL